MLGEQDRIAAPHRAIEASGDRAKGPKLGLVSVGALGACSFAVAAAERTDAHQPEFRSLRAITMRLDRAVKRGDTVLLTQGGFAALPLTPLVKYSLRRRGVHVVGYEGRTRVGPSYELHRGRYDLHVDVAESHQPATQHATVLARVTLSAASWLPGAEAPRVITVSAARPGQR